jgi:hypothetical protein
MKTRLCFLFLTLAVSFGQREPGKNARKADLTKFTSEQLTACLDGSDVCGTHDIYAITDELVGRLPQLTTDKLVSCFANWRICGTGEGRASGWPISDEIARRGNPHDLLARYWNEPNWEIRGGIEHVAYHFDSPEVTAFMQRVLIERKKDGEDFYWPANYLAKKCDLAGLSELSKGRHRNQGCMQYQSTVRQFGQCRYRPAIPYLVGNAVFDFCGNITDAALDDLHNLYPDSPKDWKYLEDAQKYYCRRARQEGFHVTCETK